MQCMAQFFYCGLQSLLNRNNGGNIHRGRESVIRRLPFVHIIIGVDQSFLAALAATAERSENQLCAASCHTRAEIESAGALGLDFAVLGPVLPTPSHPGVETLGWERFAGIARGSPLPIYALGGLGPRDLDLAIDHGAHGVALRRAAWPLS